jgi:tetratricopeptide (TPR) repeat protein
MEQHLDPSSAWAHYNLGMALLARRDLGGAIASYPKAVDLDPRHADAIGSLGLALQQAGRFAEARDASQRALALLPSGHPLRQVVTKQLHQCEQLLGLATRLTAILNKEAQPRDAGERLQLAYLCQWYKKRYAAAARFYRWESRKVAAGEK